MIADLKPYAEYKESGLPWLGEVPSHWTVLPAFGAFKPNKDQNIGMKEKTVLSLSYGRIVIKPAEKLHGLVPESFETYQIVDPGDIVLRTTDLQNDHTSLRVGMVRDRGIITSAYLALRALPGLNPDYGFQFLNVWDYSKAIYGYGSGLRQNLDFSHFKRMPIPIPPPAEQSAIVRFLDWANGRLERAIRAKRKVIALLNEQKQAIIHRAVTRGLDPSVPLKPSGIPWLGEIPAHWELSPNRAFLRVRKDLVGDRHTEFTLLSLTKRGVIVRDLSGMRGKFSSDMGTSQEVRPGDLVLCLFDVPETPRTVGLSHHAGMITGAYTVLESRSEDIAAFLELFYIAMDDRKLLSPLYSGLRNTIPKDRFLGAKTPIPPEDERTEILIAVKERTASLNMAISRLEREIDLLREYRTRLVADVVTGKLDVREAATRLPDDELLPDLAPADDEQDELPIEEEADA
jgi:type I restriction enzyme S subunit